MVIIFRTEIDVDKIISYDANSRFTYFYPRLNLQEEYKVINLNGLNIELDLILTAFNHLFEILALSYDEFELICGVYINYKLKKTIQLKDLIYQCFYEEFMFYIKPLLQLSSSWVEVEASFDRFYFIGKIDNFAYRLDKNNRIESYNIENYDIQDLSISQNNSISKKIINEKVVIRPKFVYSDA